MKVTAGEGSLITVRGKRKLGYELSAEITFKFKDGSECKAVVSKICDDEEDCESFACSQ